MPDSTERPTANTDHLTYDAIVIGSGISGGWAAKELCEFGLKTLVLERGRNVEHIKDYPTATMDPWQFKHRGQMTREFLEENPLISKAAGFGEATAHFLSKTKTIPIYRKNRSTGYGATRLAANHSPGVGPASAGANMSLSIPSVLATVLPGPSAMMMWHPGIRT